MDNNSDGFVHPVYWPVGQEVYTPDPKILEIDKARSFHLLATLAEYNINLGILEVGHGIHWAHHQMNPMNCASWAVRFVLMDKRSYRVVEDTFYGSVADYKDNKPIKLSEVILAVFDMSLQSWGSRSETIKDWIVTDDAYSRKLFKEHIVRLMEVWEFIDERINGESLPEYILEQL